jgi:hypothetical protein
MRSHQLNTIFLTSSNVTHLEERVSRRGLKEKQHSIVDVWVKLKGVKQASISYPPMQILPRDEIEQIKIESHPVGFRVAWLWRILPKLISV